MNKSVVLSQQDNHAHLCIPLTHFSNPFSLSVIGYWAKVGFDKILENYERVRRVCKG